MGSLRKIFQSEVFHRVWFFTGLLACGFLFCRGLSSVYDIHPHDETLYQWLARSSVVSPSWGPIYSFFLKVYPFFSSSEEEIYYLNFATLGVLLSLVGYLLARRLGVGRNLAFFLGVLLICAEVNIPVAPKINHLNTIFLALIFLGSTYIQSATRAVFFLLVGFIPSLYIRQDNLICAFVFGAWLIYLESKKPFRSFVFLTHMARYVLILALIFLPFRIFWGDSFGQSRGWAAFTDHFCWQKRGELCDPGKPGIESVFNGASSIVEALRINPSAFLAHGLSNLRELAVDLPYALVAHRLFFLKNESNRGWIYSFDLLLLLMLVFFLSTKFFSRTGENGFLPKHSRTNFLLLASSLGGKALVSIAVFSPWVRYYFEFWFFLLLLLVCVLSAVAKLPWARASSLWVPLVFLLLVPSHQGLATRGYFNRMSESPSLRNRYVWEIVQYVNSLGNGEGLGCRSFGAYSITFGYRYECSTFSEDLGEGLKEIRAYLEKNRVALVIVDDGYRYWSSPRPSGRSVKTFEANYHQLGFQRSTQNFSFGTYVYWRAPLVAPKAPTETAP